MARPKNPAGDIRFLQEIARKMFKKQSQYLLTLPRTDVEDAVLSGVLPNGITCQFDADSAIHYVKHSSDAHTALQALRAYRLRIGATVLPVAVHTDSDSDSDVIDVTPDQISNKPKVKVHTPPVSPPAPSYLSAEKGCMIYGPRGSGKSTAIRHLARIHGKTTITLQCAANMQLDSLIGVWTVVNGQTIFVDGPLTIAVRNGYWLLAEESNAIHPGVWSAVNTLTDRTGEPLRLPTGEEIIPHPDFRLVLLYNEGYTGTRDTNAALKRRLVPVYATYPDKPTEIQILQSLLSPGTTATATAFVLPTWYPILEYALTASLLSIQLDQTRTDSILLLADQIRKSAARFDLSTDILARWIRVKHALSVSWYAAYQTVILDMVGDPAQNAPAREVLTTLAKSAGMENWN